MSRAELILYATPSGPLADAVDGVFAQLETHGRTTAQEYPPHCTLTGFFRREAEDVPRIVAELDAAIAARDRTHPERVDVVALHRRPDWVGLELRSPWLEDVTARFVERHAVGPHDDALRPKDWLHLSIAYGVDDLRPALTATADLDHRLEADWRISLWQRHTDGAWSRLPAGNA